MGNPQGRIGSALPGVDRRHPVDRNTQCHRAPASQAQAWRAFRRQLLDHFKPEQKQGSGSPVLPVVQPAISGRWAGESGAIPNSQAAIDHPNFKQFLAKNPLGQAFIDTIPDARPFPGVVGISAVLQIVSEMVQATVLGGEAPKDALAKAATRADVALTRAQKT